MATALHTFKDIFDTDFEIEDGVIQLKKIIIPIIQRDYAQGREDAEATRVREMFLESLYQAITTDKPITLDFVYGDIDAQGIMTPLDGQQRLTTLFLLHWYAAKKESIEVNEYEFLKDFSYETRYSARNFCSYLIKFMPSFNGKISEEIIDQSWFPLEWKKDPTIKAMLVMLDAINEKFNKVNGIWERLSDNAVSFYFLPIRDMGLTDELYIKMNSRGKPLTQFEHFKAEFERELRKISEETAKHIMKKIDIDWTDMLWRYRGDDNVIDDEFLRYFRFVCDIICYKNEGSTQGKRMDEFQLLKEYFSKECDNVNENIHLLEAYFDCWVRVNKEIPPKEFLAKYISLKHEPGKIMFESKEDIFEDCLRSYADVYGKGNRSFPLNRIVLLYAIVVYLVNCDRIGEEQFVRRIRIVHNLARNSEDEISESENRSAGNRMPAILRQVDSIIIDGKINEEEAPNFNTFQLEEEKIKMEWVEKHKDLEELLYETEDHKLLRGQIAIIGLDNSIYFNKFSELFNTCSWDLIDCALMAIGDYKQADRRDWRYQLGSKKIDRAWILLFHKSANKGFDNTRNVLRELFNKLEEVSDNKLKQISDDFIAECESSSVYPWRYYYIKYPEFRPGRYGKCSWRDMENGFYYMHTLWTENKWSENSYNPFLQAAAPQFIDRDKLGLFLHWKRFWISCENDGYRFYRYGKETGKENEKYILPIDRNSDGEDIEERIQILKHFLENPQWED